MVKKINVWEAGEVEDIELEVGNIAKRGAAGMVDKKKLEWLIKKALIGEKSSMDNPHER